MKIPANIELPLYMFSDEQLRELMQTLKGVVSESDEGATYVETVAMMTLKQYAYEARGISL